MMASGFSLEDPQIHASRIHRMICLGLGEFSHTSLACLSTLPPVSVVVIICIIPIRCVAENNDCTWLLG